MSQFDFTVVGTAASVSVLKVNKMPVCGSSTAVYEGSASDFKNGGMGFNIVSGLTKLGMKVYPVLTYADERQKNFLHNFVKENGMPDDGISDPPVGSSGTTIMIQDVEKNHMTLITGYSERLPNSPYFDAQKMEKHFFDSKYCILTAPLPKNTSSAIDAIIDSGNPLVLSMRKDCNAFPHDLLWKAITNAEIIFANESEVEYILEEFSLKSILDLFAFNKLYCFVETLGKDGAVILYKNQMNEISEEKVPAVKMEKPIADTVGAGDGFVCGFMYGIQKGASLIDSAIMGTVMSSFILEKEGSIEGQPNESELLDRYYSQKEVLK